MIKIAFGIVKTRNEQIHPSVLSDLMKILKQIVTEDK